MKPPTIALPPATPNQQPVRIEFKGVTVTVTDRASGQRKTILTDVHGFAQPGRLLSIMGPSGAGKSTLVRGGVGGGRVRGGAEDGRRGQALLHVG